MCDDGKKKKVIPHRHHCLLLVLQQSRYEAADSCNYGKKGTRTRAPEKERKEQEKEKERESMCERGREANNVNRGNMATRKISFPPCGRTQRLC